MPRRPRTGVDPGRGRHRKARSREMRAAEGLLGRETQLPAAPGAGAAHEPVPGRPPWMTEDVYQRLSALRAELEGLS